MTNKISTNERPWIFNRLGIWLLSSVIIKSSNWKPPFITYVIHTKFFLQALWDIWKNYAKKRFSKWCDLFKWEYPVFSLWNYDSFRALFCRLNVELIWRKKNSRGWSSKGYFFSPILVVNCFRDFPSFYQEFCCFGHTHNKHNRVKVIM